VGLVWLAVFFVCRIAPYPLLVGCLALGELGGTAAWLRGLLYLTVPLPLMLNAFWFVLRTRTGGSRAASHRSIAGRLTCWYCRFYLGMKGLVKFLLKGSSTAKDRRDA
jgi:hypothetical protein